MQIGAKIKALRIANDLTLEELASRSELTKGFLSQLERDLTSPSISTLEDILEALGTNLSEFFAAEPEEQIVLKPGELLNTELRIFAIIRLGKAKIIRSNGSFPMHKKMRWNPFC